MYKYAFTGRNLFIVDLSSGNRSVTNDAERVLDSITRETEADLDEWVVLYQDSDRRWTQLLTENGRFKEFRLLFSIE